MKLFFLFTALFQWQAALSAPLTIPQVKIIPSYSNDSRVLERLFIMTMEKKEDPFFISGDISGFPTNASNLSSFNSTFELTSCEEDSGCSIELPSSFHCSQSTIMNFTISAANKMGEGPNSNPFIIECTNNFLQVVHKESLTESVISCVFQNQSDDSRKTCCIAYEACNQNKPQKFQECNGDFRHEIGLEVSDSAMSDQLYCYTVTASNDTYTVKVKGSFIAGFDHRENGSRAATATAIVISSSLVFLWVSCTVTIIICCSISKKRRSRSRRANSGGIPMQRRSRNDPLKNYRTDYNLPSTLRPYKVERCCELRQYITETANVKFKRGHTYYEFTNEKENILEEKEVLLLQEKQNTEKWFRLAPEKVAAGRLKLYGEGIARRSFGDQYRVFIQSFGSGARHLPHSWILYNNSEDPVEPDTLPLVPICSKHFAHRVINSEKGCTAQQFCVQNGLNTTAFNIFLTVDHLPERMRDQPPRDVILMDRESRKLFTGPLARQMLDPINGGESQHENEKWKVFVLLEMNKQGLILTNGSEVLYQDSNYQKGMFTVLDVDEDCVRLSKFIETNLNNCQYEDGKAFYEVMENEDGTEREEDLLYYKKILRPEQKQLSCGELELQSLIEYFYAIPGVPTLAVKPEQLRLEHHRIFIQSTSQGSRCLKKGEKVLYLKEYKAIRAHSGSVSSEDEHYSICEQN